MEKKQKKIDWYCGYAPFVVCKKRFRQNSEIKNAPKVHKEKSNVAKISFEVVSEKYKADEKKKIQKISFFWHDPFYGYTDKPKKFKSLL